MQIRLLKKSDGGSALTCTRDDGSVTWQPQHRHAAFFAPHDLTHFAVETTLQFDDAFYGLLASGWEIDDFGPPWPRGMAPARALFAELLVGLLDAERASGISTPADELAEHMRVYAESHGTDTAHWVTLSEHTLASIRTTRDALIAQWATVQPGDALTLSFPA
jgi:hypothetical protein